MSKLTILAGIPYSGKSHYAEKLKGEGAIVLSSDALRLELFGDENCQEKNESIFDELYKRAKQSLDNGEHVVIDATNINAKRRIHLIQQEFRKYENKEIRALILPYNMALQRTHLRDRIVPMHAVKRMFLNYQIPTFEEGWDDVYFKISSITGHKEQMTRIRDDLEEMITDSSQTYEMMRKLADAIYAFQCVYDLPQDSKYHTLSVSRHIYHVWDFLINHPTVQAMDKDERLAVLWTALFHDTGKFETKVFENSKREVTRYAHYYNHENVSAQHAIYNLFLMGYKKEFAMKVAKYCLWHMKLLNVDAEWGSKSAKKFANFVGENTLEILQLFREADTSAK